MTNKDKLLSLVSQETTNTLKMIQKSRNNREVLNESQTIALKVLKRLDEWGWTQKDLAHKLKVSPQQVYKITSGKENFTLTTLLKLQEVLDIPILASYYEKNKVNSTHTTNSTLTVQNIVTAVVV